MFKSIARIFGRSGVNRFAKVDPYALQGAPLMRVNARQPDAKSRNQVLGLWARQVAAEKRAGISLWAKDVFAKTTPAASPASSPRGSYLARVPAPVAPPALVAAEAARRSRQPSQASSQTTADSHAAEMDAKAGRQPVLAAPGEPATKHAPNDYLGFPEGWQSRLPGKASADAVARFDRLRNSLDHYGAMFATSKEARGHYRAAYADMRAIFLAVSKERYALSPHDAEGY